MTPIDDHAYLKVCAQLASCSSISIASARRQVELVARKKGVKELSERKVIAHQLLEKAISENKSEEGTSSTRLDLLLKALAEEENFMVED